MKNLVQLAVTAALAAGATAEMGHQRHAHMHRHRAVNVPAADVVEKRAPAVTTVVTPVETKYVYSDGESVNAAEAKECIENGECLVVGTSTPTSTTAATTKATKQAAEFFESKASSSTKTSTTSTSTSTSTTSTSTSTSTTSTSSTSTTAAAASTSAANSTSGSGSSSEFPSGQIPCSHFPSDYGAVAVDWVGLDGWASIQTTGSWTPGVSISDIVEPTSGGCTSGSFCSYACAPGQTKAQWPTTSQGSTGQSIGGLWCNSDGYLELTNDNFNTLCMDGLGGISVENQLSDVACVCGTNYPGNEMMNIPLVTQPGGTYTLTNINAKTAYQWEGKYTSGQFYVNNAGVSEEQACIWTSSEYPDSAGNWAPVNIGAGTDIYGVTYISIFPNTPTSTAQLDFDIEITGDITSECYLKSGSYPDGSTTGCTTALTSGGSCTIVFKPSS
ncbi:Sperm-associated antigen 4 protein [Sporothrix eucalyptigena]|uniref:Sperm-associated antigen 4 protein n=1 Tax=Sporothrix eucalyptigena TaxID=1812306 RepID=A0ABP0C5J3_9PEZI